MTNVTNELKKISDLVSTKGASNEQIVEAQNKLSLEFPTDFIEYLKEFGLVNFYGVEWQGLNGPDYLNVVKSTLEARETYPDFPVNMFILEDLGFDGFLILVDTKGSVYEWKYVKFTLKSFFISRLITYFSNSLKSIFLFGLLLDSEIFVIIAISNL